MSRNHAPVTGPQAAADKPAGKPKGHPGGNPYMPSPWVKTVISPQGQRDTWRVAIIRILGAVLTGVPLAVSGLALGNYASGIAVPSSYWYVSAVCIVGAGVLVWYSAVVGGHAAHAEERRLRRKLLERNFAAAYLPRNRSEEFSSARMVQLMSDNAERATEYRQRFSGSAYASLITPFIVLGAEALFFDWASGLVIMILCPIIPVSLVLFLRFFRKTSANSRRARARLSGKYLDAIRNLVTIRLFGAGKRIEGELRVAGEENRGAIMKLLAGNQLVIVVVDGLFSLILIVISVLVVIWRYNAGALTIGQAIAIVLLSVLLIEPLTQVAGFFYIGMGGKASLAAIGKYLKSDETAHSAHAATHNAPASSESDAPDTTQAISVHSLSFDYGQGTVLDDINLDVAHGEKIAIIGRSGGGKSTLLSLMRGSLPVTQGAVSIDGHDTRTMDAHDIRALSASVSQNTWLFTGTIATNLRLAKQDATEEDMWNALKAAHIADEIKRMPDQLDTYIGEGGALLSGGQAQRISIARALLSGRTILLLDEPTSHVDRESEAHIIDALEELGKEWTVLIVTHRHSLLRAVDKAYSMDGGHLRHVDIAELTHTYVSQAGEEE